MLPVFSVILEYRMDGRNSSDRPTVSPQFLYCMCILHSRHFKATQTRSFLNHSRIELTYFMDFKYIHKQRNYSVLRRST